MIKKSISKIIILLILTLYCMPSFSANESVTAPLDETIKYTVGKVAPAAQEMAMKELSARWMQKYGKNVIDMSDASKFKNYFTNIGLILDALTVGEAIYAGDYKSAAGTAELATISLLVPVAGQVIAVGKIANAALEGFNNEIYGINMNTIFMVFHKNEELWGPNGIDIFIDKYLMPDYKMRMFLINYSEKSLNRKVDKYGKDYWDDRKQVRVVVASLRGQFKTAHYKILELEEKKKQLKESLKDLEKFKAFVESNKDWVKKRALEITKEMEERDFQKNKINEKAQNIEKNIKPDTPDYPSPIKSISSLPEKERVSARIKAEKIKEKNIRVTERISALMEKLDYSVMPKVKQKYLTGEKDTQFKYGYNPYDADPQEVVDSLCLLKLRIFIKSSNKTQKVKFADYIETNFNNFKSKLSERVSLLNDVIPKINNDYMNKSNEQKQYIANIESLLSEIKMSDIEEYDKPWRTYIREQETSLKRKKVSDKKESKEWEIDKKYYEKLIVDLREVISKLNSEKSLITTTKQKIAEINAVSEQINKHESESLSQGFISPQNASTQISKMQDLFDKRYNLWVSLYNVLGMSTNHLYKLKVKAFANRLTDHGNEYINYINDVKSTINNNDSYKSVRKLTDYGYISKYNMEKMYYSPQDIEQKETLSTVEKDINSKGIELEKYEKYLEKVKQKLYGINDNTFYEATGNDFYYRNALDTIDDINNENTRINKQYDDYTNLYAQTVIKLKKQKNSIEKKKKEKEQKKINAENFKLSTAANNQLLFYYSDIENGYNNIKRLDVYFDKAIAKQEIGYAKTLYLGIDSEINKITEKHNDAVNYYSTLSAAQSGNNTQQTLDNIINTYTKASMIYNDCKKDLKPLVTNVDNIKTELFAIESDLNALDIINGLTDSDGDGISDKDELNAGSSPTDSNSKPYGSYEHMDYIPDNYAIVFSTGAVVSGVYDDLRFYGHGHSMDTNGKIMKMSSDFETAPVSSDPGYTDMIVYGIGDYIAVYLPASNTYAKVYIENYDNVADITTIKWWYLSDGSRNFK